MPEPLTKDEINLLLYLETCAVDYGGRVNQIRMNADDFVLIDGWQQDGYISFGRIKARHCNKDGSHWVRLSDTAWHDSRRYRRERAERMWKNRRFADA